MGNLNLKELYGFAKKHVIGLQGGTLTDFRLEQAEYVKDNSWELIVSFLVRNQNKNNDVATGLMALTTNKALPYERVFKKLIINEEGELVKFLMYRE